MLQLFGKVFLIAVAVNFPWEMAQAYLYAPMGDWVTATMRCFRAAIVDGAIVLGIAVGGTAVFRRRDWCRRLGTARVLFIVVAGATIAVLIERFSLSAGRWNYGQLMPIIPGIDVGAIPVLQMMVVPLIVFHIAARTTSSPL